MFNSQVLVFSQRRHMPAHCSAPQCFLSALVPSQVPDFAEVVRYLKPRLTGSMGSCFAEELPESLSVSNINLLGWEAQHVVDSSCLRRTPVLVQPQSAPHPRALVCQWLTEICFSHSSPILLQMLM